MTDTMNEKAAPDSLLETIQEFARWHHLNSMVVAQGGTPSDSEIDFEVIAWNTIKRALGKETKTEPTPVLDPEIMELFVAGKSVYFDPATKTFHADNYYVVGPTMTYEPISWNYEMDGFDKEAARIGRAAFERLVDLDLVSDTSNDADEIIDALALLQVVEDLPSESHQDFEELVRLARAANPAPHHIYTNPRDDNNWRANADFHAAASPDAVLALIAAATSARIDGTSAQGGLDLKALDAALDAADDAYLAEGDDNLAFKKAVLTAIRTYLGHLGDASSSEARVWMVKGWDKLGERFEFCFPDKEDYLKFAASKAFDQITDVHETSLTTAACAIRDVSSHSGKTDGG